MARIPIRQLLITLPSEGSFCQDKEKEKKTLDVFLLAGISEGEWLIVLEVLIMIFEYNFGPIFNKEAPCFPKKSDLFARTPPYAWRHRRTRDL